MTRAAMHTQRLLRCNRLNVLNSGGLCKQESISMGGMPLATINEALTVDFHITFETHIQGYEEEWDDDDAVVKGGNG